MIKYITGVHEIRLMESFGAHVERLADIFIRQTIDSCALINDMANAIHKADQSFWRNTS